MLRVDAEQKESYQRLDRTARILQACKPLGCLAKRGKRTPAALFGCPPLPLFKAQASASARPSRTFPLQPERVLDAPGLLDDFYLNVLDWGRRDVLAVALGPLVYLWDGRTGEVKELMGLESSTSSDPGYVASLRWIHDGTALAIGTSSGHVQIWDAHAGKRIRTLTGSEEQQRVASLAWNRHLLSTGSRDGVVRTNDVRQAKPLVVSHQLSSQRDEICSMAWCPDGEQLAAGSNANLVHIWDAGQAAARHTLAEHRAAVKALAWCPWRNGGLLATGGGSQDKCIKTWNTHDGSLRSTIATDSPVSALVWSVRSKEIVSTHGQSSNAIRLWAPGLTRVAGLDQAHAGRILHACLSPDGQTLVTASAADESIKFWRAFEPEDEDGPSQGAPGKKGIRRQDVQHVLMPRFSRSSAVARALNQQHQQQQRIVHT